MSAERTFEARELSPRGHGAVSIVAVRGPGALARVRELCARDDLTVGDVRLVTLRAQGERLDRALCIVARDDDVELHLHGNPLLVARLCSELGGALPSAPRRSRDREFPSDPRTPGERAFPSDPRTPEERGLPSDSKTSEERELSSDLSTSAELEPPSAPRAPEERAFSMLARAATDSAARILLDQAEGALRRAVDLELRADDPLRLAALVDRSRTARFALAPTRVVLAGPVNAGKSMLFNLLLGERRAIESAEPGTTRDVLRAHARFGAYPIELFDVAGVRPLSGAAPEHAVERAGQELARELCARADWIVWLSPEGERSPPELGARATAFLSRADQAAPELRSRARRSLASRTEPAAAVAAVHAAFREHFSLPEEPWSPGMAVTFDEPTRAALDLVFAAGSAEARRAVWPRVVAAH
ncbi:MAG: 50S ribosome-binding GTPase [Planctomycetes bacterium]|nr:50S ribosome-binding GTPase [Planctomycetota bacterium]